MNEHEIITGDQVVELPDGSAVLLVRLNGEAVERPHGAQIVQRGRPIGLTSMNDAPSRQHEYRVLWRKDEGTGVRDRPRVHPFLGNVLVHVENMQEGDSDQDGPEQARRETRTPTTDLNAAMVLTSDTGQTAPFAHYDETRRAWTDEHREVHRPVLDIDFPVTVLPSSTPGHSHVLIDYTITWDRYVVLLDALAAAGLVESGYVEASKVRGHTGVRVPWFRKGDPAPSLPLQVQDEASAVTA